MELSEVLKISQEEGLDEQQRKLLVDGWMRSTIGDDYTSMDPPTQSKFLETEINRAKPVTWTEMLTTGIPFIGPAIREDIYGRPGRETTGLMSDISQALSGVPTYIRTGEEGAQIVPTHEATVAEQARQLFLMGITSNLGPAFGVIGNSLKSFVTREAIENAAYGVGELIFDPTETIGEAAAHVAISGAGGAAASTVIRGLGRGIGNYIGTHNSYFRRLSSNLGSPEASVDFMRKANEVTPDNVISTIGEKELDAAIQATGSGRGKAGEIRSDLIRIREMRNDAIRNVELTRMRELELQQNLQRQITGEQAQLGSEVSARDISNRRMDEMLGSTYIDAQERITQLADANTYQIQRLEEAGQLFAGEESARVRSELTANSLAQQRIEAKLASSNITAQEQIALRQQAEGLRVARRNVLDLAELNTERTMSRVNNDNLTAALRESAIVSQEQIALSQATRNAQRLAAHSELRARAGLPAHVTDDALRALPDTDFRVRAENKIRDVEKKVINDTIVMLDEVKGRLGATVDLASGSGKVTPEAVAQLNGNFASPGMLSKVDDLNMNQAKEVSQALKVSGFNNVRILLNKTKGGYSVVSSLGESLDEINATNLQTKSLRSFGVVDAERRLYEGLTSQEHVELAKYLGMPDAQANKLGRFVDQTLDQARRANMKLPVTVNQLGIPPLQEQIKLANRTAATIRTDVGQILPPPKPFLVGEPIAFDNLTSGEADNAVVQAIAITQSGKQSIIAALSDGTQIHVTDDMMPRHLFDEPQAAPGLNSDASTTLISDMRAIDPSTRVPAIKIDPTQINDGINILKSVGVKVRSKLLPGGDVILDVDGVMKGRFNPQETASIIENLIRSKMTINAKINKLGGKGCL